MFKKLAMYVRRVHQNIRWLMGDTEYFDIGAYVTQKLPEPQPLTLPVARLVYEVEDKLECARQREIGENE